MTGSSGGVQTTFLEARSFIAEETESPQASSVPLGEAVPSHPFLSLYDGEGEGLFDPNAAEYMTFLNELYDEEFEEALFELASEASSIYESKFTHEHANGRTLDYQAERLLEQHFAPLVKEAQAMLGSIAEEFSRRDTASLTDDEITAVVERYQPSTELAPSFEQFLGKLKKAVKKVASKAVNLAKKGISAAAKLGLGPILEKLKPLIKPLLKRVIQTAIGKLPSQLQPVARKLAEQFPFLKEFEESDQPAAEHAEMCQFAQIQQEFDYHVANVLFAPTEIEQDLEVAEALKELQSPHAYTLTEIDRARDEFTESLRELKEGEDPTPYVENFIPAILPALKLGISIVGRKRVVDFLAKFLARLIQKFIGPQYAPALSRAIVDAGLRLIHLETTPEDESRAAASAVAATVEETVRRVSALPDYVLDDQELLEAFALEAFEQAAAANLPPILPEETYRKRPDLAEARKLRGAWIMMPRGRRKRYKKFTRAIPVKILPRKAATVESFEGIALDQFLEEELGVAPGEEVEAIVHLYESIPGTDLPSIAHLEQHTPGLGTHDSHEQLHPLTPEAAGLLLGEPAIGREADPRQLADSHTPSAGQRFYYLEIPGKKPLAAPGMADRVRTRRPTQVRLALDFPKNEIRIHFFLSEIRAQEIAVKLRQHAHTGAVVARLRGFLERGLRNALSGAFGRLKIIHEAVTPEQWSSAFRRLPSLVPRLLLSRLQEWVIKGLMQNLKQHAEMLIKAAEETADGVTVVITVNNPPGFTALRDALKGKVASLASLRLSDGQPDVIVRVAAGYTSD